MDSYDFDINNGPFENNPPGVAYFLIAQKKLLLNFQIQNLKI